MKITCEVARDLAELYHEHLVSKESAREIRAHLKECSRCKRYYKAYDALNTLQFPLRPAGETEAAEARSYEVLSRRLRKNHMIRLIGTSAAIGAGTIMLTIGLVMMTRSEKAAD